MPVTVVVGGQYGSEGKGKVALSIARTGRAAIVVRVGGPNSGHTGFDKFGKGMVLRQLPASALADQAMVVLPPGSLIDPDLLRQDILDSKLDPARLLIDARASVVTAAHRLEEASESLVDRIGSTGSGTGAALRERISRIPGHPLAGSDPYLKQFVHPSTSEVFRAALNQNERIVIEGTQGFGLSIWHGDEYPMATSRDTTAASFVSEAGLAPHDVDDVVLVLRTFPIRVGGNSGPLENEIDWPTLAREAELPEDFVEYTSATKRVRRVGRFDPHLVKRAIAVNNPHRVVLNHLDYVDPSAKDGIFTARTDRFLSSIESSLNRTIDLVGINAATLINRPGTAAMLRHAS